MRWLAIALLGLGLTVGGAALGLQPAQAKAKPTAKAAVVKKPQVRKSRAATPKALRKPAVDKRLKQIKSVAPSKPAPLIAAKASFGQLYGLDKTDDPLDLKSNVALVLDQDTGEVLLAKNDGAVLPIASITKLMTALVVTEAGLPLDEVLSVSEDDVDTEKHTGSRLRVGAQLTRGEMLHLALMSSENRAAHALGRHYPGGLRSFVAAMNAKAAQLGMKDTSYVEPTGLSPANQSSANDLARLVKTAYQVPLIRELSTSTGTTVRVGRRDAQFGTTNRLVKSPSWDIGLQKTGYIAEAGQCLVMQAQMAGRRLVMVFLDSAGKYSRIGDAERVRRWLSDSLAQRTP